MTKSHDDRINLNDTDYGYSIRVGKTLPANSANLAYVHSTKASPKANLLLTDMSSKIIDNTVSTKFSTEAMVFPDDTFLLREIGKPFASPTGNIVLTDEFSVPVTTQERPAALYYQAEVKGYFDGRGADLVYWPGGYVERPISDILSYSDIDEAQLASAGSLLYLSKKIRITKLDGTPVDSTCKYKIQLVQQSGAGVPPHTYKIVVYTNFRGSADHTYVVRYERYNADGSHTADFVEILNAYPFFSKVPKEEIDTLAKQPRTTREWKPELQAKKYAVVEGEDKQWSVYSPAQVLIADNVTRPAHQFEYRIRGKLRTKLSSNERGALHIGLVYLNDNVFGAEDLRDALKKTYESSYKPPYLDFVNPHPVQNNLPKENPNYWNIDLTMPADHLNDYDLIILTGYGVVDMSFYNDSLRSYLENGGRLWIDNAGVGDKVLDLQKFLVNVGFSKTEQSTGAKISGVSANTDPLTLEAQALSRLYMIDKAGMDIGYTEVDPKMTYGVGENAALWRSIIKYSNNDHCLMAREMYGTGTMIVSNCGILRSLINKTSDDIKVSMNMILAIAEQKWVNTPWIHDYVYHRDNLFKEEYTNGDHDVYMDDRNDNDSTQVVAKKIMNKTVRDALIPYMPSSYYKSKGTFHVEVKADTELVVPNADFEVGRFNPATNAAITSWTGRNAEAIPGWSTWNAGSTGPTYTHVSAISKRGIKAISITSASNTTGHWSSAVGALAQGTYRASIWVKTENLNGGGAILEIQSGGEQIARSQPLLGTMDWTQINIDFSIEKRTEVEIRIGLSGGNGTFWADHVSLVSLGSVFTTPEGDGSSALYAYAVRPRGDVFDLKSQGFSNADVTIYDPEIEISYTIKSFVHVWDNGLTRYVRKYGNSKSYKAKIRKSDGMMSLGLLTTSLPALQAGPEWADKNKVFFEVSVGDSSFNDSASEFVNIGFFNTRGGHYFYSKTGEDVIGYTELFDGKQTEAFVIIQAWTTYYTIRATKRRYAVRVQDDERIYLDYPATIDERDAWHVRVHNGSFTKRGLQYDEYEEFRDFYTNRQFGVFSYSIPEYGRQLFTPGEPYKRVRKEIAEYVDDATIRVQRSPLYVQSGKARLETMTDLTGYKTIFKASKGNWIKTSVSIYRDTNGNGIFFPTTSGFDIDYASGVVMFDHKVSGVVKVDYDYNNLQVFKRNYTNAKVKKELLQAPSKTLDHRTFVSDHANWLLYPAPSIYTLPDGTSEYQIIPVETYMIDYEEGSVEFKSDTFDRIYIDYSYTVDKPIGVRDYDVQSGLIYLENTISFKDEIYVNYAYEENFYEYRGYYDSNLRKFIQLDLNPTEGHYCTIPVYRTDPATNNMVITKYDQVPTAKLMNKEVYIYIIPRSGSFDIQNEFTIKHCYSEAEWLKIRKTMPGVAILLGIVQLREHTRVEDVVVLDTRVRGGGLKTSFNRDAIQKRSTTSLSYWDMGPWDGTAYYKNGVMIIQLPKSILQSEGGQFSEKQVDDIIKKYVAYGVYYLVEYGEFEGKPKTVFLQGASFPNTLHESRGG